MFFELAGRGGGLLCGVGADLPPCGRGEETDGWPCNESGVAGGEGGARAGRGEGGRRREGEGGPDAGR